MPENGPVHNRCRLTDTQLLAKRIPEGPCTGCTTQCPQWDECQQPSDVMYADGVNNATINLDGKIWRNYPVECCLQLPSDWTCMFNDQGRLVEFAGDQFTGIPI